MMAYIARRLLQTVVILLGISFVTFILLYLIPADPARQIAGRSATAQTVENIREQLGLNLPFYEQYMRYVGGLVQGDFGRSYLQKTEVSTLIASRLPASLLLMAGAITCELIFGLTMGIVAALRAGAITCELIFGLTMGIVAALRRGSRTDDTLMIASFVGVSAPQFVVGILLLYVFAVKLGWFPIGGYGTFAHLVLPSLTLGFLGAGWYSRMMRSSLIEVMRQDFIRTARATGNGRAKVLFRHAMPNAILPVIAMIGIDIGLFMSGIVVVESVFGWPGIGQLAWQAIQRVDIPIIMGVTLVSAFAIVLGNLLADLITPLIDPRIKLR
ncbi:glutathione ABC transporter permease GsiC [Sinorhizobium medicae]|uniref:ABC transporter permease n=1 Tax=Sinorhizobium medicae TaxID=110321 RepID=UPI000C7A5C9A|nr:ABC transporter permease [Sinorhizobium medicae]PLU50967.1 glutathione ABC transporter permease GsiC [Sinorhizobium medicae]